MAQCTFTNETMRFPAWAAEELTPDRLISGGRLLASEFLAIDSVQVTVNNGSGIGLGATTIAVDAVPMPYSGKKTGVIPAGALLNFGLPPTATVTIADADMQTGHTSITITALAAGVFIPAGTVLTFGTTTPTALTVTRDAIAGDTTLNVVALTAPQVSTLANSEAATFTGQPRIARVVTAVNADATSITVDPIQFTLADDTVGTYAGVNPRIAVESGTLVGRTFAERTAKTGFGQPDVTAPTDDELFLTAFTIEDAAINPDVVLLRHQTKIYEDLLPGWAGLSSDAKTVIRARYHCLLSAG